MKLLNNMVLSVTVLALAEALAVQAAGTARRMLEDTVALGLGDAYHTAVVEAVRKQAG